MASDNKLIVRWTPAMLTINTPHPIIEMNLGLGSNKTIDFVQSCFDSVVYHCNRPFLSNDKSVEVISPLMDNGWMDEYGNSMTVSVLPSAFQSDFPICKDSASFLENLNGRSLALRILFVLTLGTRKRED